MNFEDYRKSGFDKAMTEAKQMVSKMGVKDILKEKYIIQKKTSFDECDDEEITQLAKESFAVNYFFFLMD